jgi:hypothetical protein
VDQPAQVGFSIGDVPQDNTVVTDAFYSWLKQFYNTFPNLRPKNLYLIGESWGTSIEFPLMVAGIYVPYFANIIQRNQHKYPVNLKAIGTGNPSLGNNVESNLVAAVTLVVSLHGNIDIRLNNSRLISMAPLTCLPRSNYNCSKTSLSLVDMVLSTESLLSFHQKES